MTKRPPRKQSAVNRLCGEYEKAHAIADGDFESLTAAERAHRRALPRAPDIIRRTKKNLADLGPGTIRAHIPITSGEIEGEVRRLRTKSVKRDDPADGTIVLTISETETFPLTRKERAQLARLERRLPVALAYEAKSNRIAKRFRVDELEAAASVSGTRAMRLLRRIAATPSKSREDLLAKARIFEIDRSLDLSDDIADSIAGDFVRLAGAGLA